MGTAHYFGYINPVYVVSILTGLCFLNVSNTHKIAFGCPIRPRHSDSQEVLNTVPLWNGFLLSSTLHSLTPVLLSCSAGILGGAKPNTSSIFGSSGSGFGASPGGNNQLSIFGNNSAANTSLTGGAFGQNNNNQQLVAANQAMVNRGALVAHALDNPYQINMALATTAQMSDKRCVWRFVMMFLRNPRPAPFVIFF